MKTLREYLASRKGLLLYGNITESQLYEAYRKFCESRGELAWDFEDVRPWLQREIWFTRLHWASHCIFLTENYAFA